MRVAALQYDIAWEDPVANFARLDPWIDAAATAGARLLALPEMYACGLSEVDLGPSGWDPEFGWGRVNAHDALIVLQNLIFIDGFETGDLSSWSFSSP